jgi:hypothetical protein
MAVKELLRAGAYDERVARASSLVPMLTVAIGSTAIVCCAPRAIAPPDPTPPQRPAPPPAVVIEVPAAPDTEPAADDAIDRRARADAAVAFVAQRLFEHETECRDEWKSADVCGDPKLDDAAADYQAVWFFRDDPRRTEGRIDALPRLGGRGIETRDAQTRVRAMCRERCDIARHGAIGEATHIAQEACIAKKSHAPCAALAKRVARTAPSEVEKWTAVCEEACDEKRERIRYDEEIERKRPRTEAQSRTCYDACVWKCNGGRPHDPDDWCGTCEFTCKSHCAVRGTPITLP